MKKIIVTQRVDIIDKYTERRDAIDQNWYSFCDKIGVSIVLAPNNLKMLHALLTNIRIDGVLLTGGNSHIEYGGNAPERDNTDRYLIEYASDNKLPLIGVCRGCQSIALHYSGKLCKVDNHVGVRHFVSGKINKAVNSFHEYAVTDLPNCFTILSTTNDGVIEAIQKNNILGIMWHPERESSFCNDDINIFQKHFGV